MILHELTGALPSEILAVHKVHLCLLCEVDPRRPVSVSHMSGQALHECSIHAAACLLNPTAVLRVPLDGLLLTVLDLAAVPHCASALVTFADLLFRHVLALVWQVVRVGVLGCDLFDRMPELCSIDS